MTKQFTTDWLTHNLKPWREHLLHLNGTPCRILEIGTYEGRAACWFAENLMNHRNAQITSVDPNPRKMANGHTYWWHNTCHTQAPCMRLVEDTSDGYFYATPGALFDLIYVDGDHYGGQVMKDGINSWNALKVGGILVFDDYAWTDAYKPQEQPKPAIDYILSLYKGKYELLEKGWQVILKKTSN